MVRGALASGAEALSGAEKARCGVARLLSVVVLAVAVSCGDVA